MKMPKKDPSRQGEVRTLALEAGSILSLSVVMLGALSGIPQDVPPYVTAVVARPRKGPSLYGLNVIGLKRNRFTEEAISALKKAYRILFRSGAPMGDAIARVEAEVELLPEVRRLLDFIRSSKRGVLR